jgi:peptidoglycan-N-acetylglucosamine deacetylase
VTRPLLSLVLALSFAASLSPAIADETCPNPKKALGVSRIIEIDPSAGPLFGEFTKYEKEPRFLGPKEVVLTFDDGPMPKYTKPILEALDKFCTKATFFYVGRMAMAYPDMVKEVMGRGHTMGTHTWSHPMNMRRRGLNSAKDQIERGFAAVQLAAGKPIAPFFRFPGLSDSGPMLDYLQKRGIAAFTVDVVSNDSYISSPQRLIQRTLAQVERQNGGIILFHDIKRSTARALPTILAELKKRGYKVVHLRSKSEFEPLPKLTDSLKDKYAKKLGLAEKDGKDTDKADVADADDKKDGKKRKLVPFYAISPLEPETGEVPDVTEIVPEPRKRTRAGGTHSTANDPVSADGDAQPRPKARQKRAGKSKGAIANGPVMTLTGAVSGKF